LRCAASSVQGLGFFGTFGGAAGPREKGREVWVWEGAGTVERMSDYGEVGLMERIAACIIAAPRE
jgi:hypothetical protein